MPPTAGSTSIGLLARAKERDANAWRQLVQLYAPLVYYWSRESRLQPADAADLVQEVFSSVAKGLSDFDGTRRNSSFRGWLRTITRNRVLDHFRRQMRTISPAGGSTNERRLRQIEEEPSLLPAESPAIAQQHDRVHKALEIWRMEVTEQTWEVFWRTAMEGQAAADVARDLEMSVGAVYQAKSRALDRLRILLDAGDK